MYELFDPRDGKKLFSLPFAFFAGFVARVAGLDYAKAGEGWIL